MENYCFLESKTRGMYLTSFNKQQEKLMDFSASDEEGKGIKGPHSPSFYGRKAI